MRDKRVGRIVGVWHVALAVVVLGVSVAAAETPILDREWHVAMGGYISRFTTDASVGVGRTVGTLIRAEDELGIEAKQSNFRLEARYRFNERHSLNLGYWTATREGRRAIEKQIEFDGVFFDIGADLESKAELSYLRMAWMVSLVKSERGHAGFSLGLSAFDFGFEIAGQGVISDGVSEPEVGYFRTREELLVPAPTVGVFLAFAITPRLFLRARGEFLDARVGDIEGTLSETMLAIDWYFTKNIGLGAGGLLTSLRYRETGDAPLQVDYRQRGIIVYVTSSF